MSLECAHSVCWLAEKRGLVWIERSRLWVRKVTRSGHYLHIKYRWTILSASSVPPPAPLMWIQLTPTHAFWQTFFFQKNCFSSSILVQTMARPLRWQVWSRAGVNKRQSLRVNCAPSLRLSHTHTHTHTGGRHRAYWSHGALQYLHSTHTHTHTHTQPESERDQQRKHTM